MEMENMAELMSGNKDMDISVVVPVYNSEATLGELVARLGNVLTKNVAGFEVILVNDGSKDGSWKVIYELAKQFNWLRGINLMRNYGQHNALLCGVRAASRQVIVTLDDDLQNPPEEIPKLLSKLNEGYDLVYGCPEKRESGVLRKYSSIFIKYILSCVLGMRILRFATSFRAFKTELRDIFADYHNFYVSLNVLLLRATDNVNKIIVTHMRRANGKSNYGFRQLISHILNLLFTCGISPLKITVMCGMLFAIFGFIFLFYLLIKYYLIGKIVLGFAFITAIISVFTGMQLIILGIVGEYLGKIYFRFMNHPVYLVRESINI
jgi:undecaprenyl-phosphate 4-deoxy-4-formamido-L-arabinose transferase